MNGVDINGDLRRADGFQAQRRAGEGGRVMEIKFRAHSKTEKRMIPWHELKCHPQLVDILEGIYMHAMQYTGLHDKSGREIYAGDIIKTVTDKAMVISWSDRFASFCIDREGWAFTHWFGESCEPNEVEVIGNIYENPELIG